jgi:hypothetical protein
MESFPASVYEEMKDTVNATRSRKATLTELATRVPEEHFEDLKDALAMNDRDKSGKVNHDTFMKCCQIACMNAT